jgi:predicted membrane channel-forming protein YqfA (hemolysin III family)
LSELLYFIVEFLGEFLLSVFIESLGVLFNRSLRDKEFSNGLNALIFIALGGVAGWLSLFVLPHLLIPATHKTTALIVGPAALVLLIGVHEYWRSHDSPKQFRRGRLLNAGLLVLVFSAIRYFGAK